MKRTSDSLFNFNNANISEVVFNAISEAIVIVNRDGIIQLVNKPGETLFGYSLEEMLGKKIDLLLPPRCLENHPKFCGDFFDNPETRRMGIGLDVSAKRKDGSEIPIEIGLSSFSDGGKQYVTAIITDITKRKNIERDLDFNRKKYQAVFDKANDYIVLLDHSGYILEINDKIKDIGYTKEEIVGLNLRQVPFLSDHEIRKTLVYFQKRLQGEPLGRYELEFTAKDGHKIIGEVNASMVDLHNGQNADIVLIRDITDRKNLEYDINESRDYLENLLNSTLDVIIAVDTDRKIVLFNSAAETTFGYTQDEIIGQPANMLYVHQDESQEVREKMETSGSYSGEIVNKKKNGETFTAYLSSSTLFNSTGKVTGYLGVSRDISNYKLAEQMRESLLHDLDIRVRELDCLFQIARIANRWELSLDDILKEAVKILPVSWQYHEDACARITVEGLTNVSHGFVETQWSQSSPVKIHGEEIGSIEIFYKKEKPLVDEGPFTKGERKLLDAVSSQIGKILDHKNHETERRELINILSTKTFELNTVLDSIGDAIVTTDNDYTITSVNKAFCEMVGVSYERVMGHHCEELFKCGKDHGEEDCLSECGLFEALEEKKNSITRSTITTFEGRSLVIESINSPLIDNSGNVIGAVKSMRDISKEVEIERMKNEFVATVSHELRTPLTSIKGYVELFLDGDTGEINEIQEEFLEIISQNSDRLTLLINDLLDIEKLEAGKIRLSKREFDLSELAFRAFRTFEPNAGENNVKYISNIDDNITIFADPDRIMQVITNLLSNAVKFTKEGFVTMAVKEENDHAVITVSDTGMGISKTDRKKLFTRFFRAEDAVKSRIGGTGLGLSIVKSIVDLHKGDIAVSSAILKGTHFTVTLPIIQDEPA